MKSTATGAIGGLVLLAAGGAARAEPVTFFGYVFNASVRAELAPSYEGGKTYNVFPGGSLAITKPWEFDSYGAPDDAASLALINTKRFSIGTALSLRENRGNSGVLDGMRNIGWAFQGGGFVNFWPTNRIRVHGEALKGLTAESGWLVNAGADYVTQTNKFTIGFGPRFSWADGSFNGRYFGVTPAEAAASPYIAAPFLAKAGPHFAGAEINAEYKLFSRWRLTMDGSYHRLLSDDARSPLVRQLGQLDQFSAGMGVRFMLTD